MGKKGESTCGVLALALGIVAFCLIQMQFNGFSKVTGENALQASINSDDLSYLMIKPVDQHRHNGMYGEVIR